MKYQEAYDKIIQAYFNNKIKPLDAHFCFCGTLCNNDIRWFYGIERIGNYSHFEYKTMEAALFKGISDIVGSGWAVRKELDKNWEEGLFNGMSLALDELRKIHTSRGETIDEPVPFVKRKLELAK